MNKVTAHLMHIKEMIHIVIIIIIIIIIIIHHQT